MSVNPNELSIKINENSKMKKFFILILMLIILLIPIGFWFGIIKERESYKQDAIKSIASAWGDVQIFSSPTMSFEKKKDKTTETVYLPLNTYNADVKIMTEVRKKGIFKVPVYTAEVKLKGDFTNNYGNISDKEILVLNGSNVCFKILNGSLDISKYKLILSTHSTIRNLGMAYGWDKVTNLFIKMKIGTKIYDECHKDFQNLYKIDYYTNTYKTIYISATLNRSSKDEDFVYQLYFKINNIYKKFLYLI